MPKFTGINHLAMITGKIDSTIRFWRDLVGLRLIVSLGKSGYKIYFFEISENDMIGFFEWPGVLPIDEKEHGTPAQGKIAFDHLAIGVEGQQSLVEIKQRLEAADIWVSEIIDHGFIHSIYTFDPNGIPVEFTHYVPGIDVHHDPLLADESPSPARLEGVEPQSDKWPRVDSRSVQENPRVYPGFGLELFDKRKGK